MLDLAINELEVTLETYENNAPINRKEGNIAQAKLEEKIAKQVKRAIGQLEENKFRPSLNLQKSTATKLF